MIASPQFTALPKSFWACVRYISQKGGYTDRATGGVKAYDLESIRNFLQPFEIPPGHLASHQPMGVLLQAYFRYRAAALNDHIRWLLMDRAEAQQLFQQLQEELRPQCPIPQNKQKGEKAGPAYLTGIVNMLIEANLKDLPVDYNPLQLPTIASGTALQRTLSRRYDGCFPSVNNPIALWEIKEYYHTTTFGSRVADGIYETLLDGMELEEARSSKQRNIQHLLIVDSHFTWWVCERSYLCRLIDMLNMGYVDEVLFGKEVVDRLPIIAQAWAQAYRQQHPL